MTRRERHLNLAVFLQVFKVGTKVLLAQILMIYLVVVEIYFQLYLAVADPDMALICKQRLQLVLKNLSTAQS